jgi:hypothetical protein
LEVRLRGILPRESWDTWTCRWRRVVSKEDTPA